MFVKRIMIFVWMLMLAAVLTAIPAMAADKSGMAEKVATWEKEYNADNLNAIVGMYATDGCRMPPNQEKACGSDAIAAALKGGKDQGVTKVKLALTTAETSGDLGYALGTYEIMSADGSHVDHGKWMNVSKNVKGKWMIQDDIWNSDMPMPGMK